MGLRINLVPSKTRRRSTTTRNEKDTSELRFDTGGIEEAVRILADSRRYRLVAVHEDNIDDVVSDMTLPLYLLLVVPRIWKERRNVEHDLVTFVHRIDRVFSGHVA